MKVLNNVDFWNLDWLKKHRDLKMRGQWNLVPVEGLRDEDQAVFVRNRGIVLMRTHKRTFEILRMINDRWVHFQDARYEWSDKEDFVSISSSGNSLYALDAYRREIVQFTVMLDRVSKIGDAWVGDFMISPQTRIAIPPPHLSFHRRGSSSTKAYVGPVEENALLEIEMGPETARRVIDIEGHARNRLDPPVGTDLQFCVDSFSNSLILTDAIHDRVLEFDLAADEAGQHTSAAKVLFPQSGLDSAGLRSPGSVAVYHAHTFSDYLNDESQQILAADPTRSRLRTIVIADRGHYRLQKIIELPVGTTTLWPGVPLQSFYAFLGSGQQPKTLPTPSDEMASDLAKYPIGIPLDISLNTEGELLVHMQGHNQLLVLTPATARARYAGMEGAAKHRIGDQDSN